MAEPPKKVDPTLGFLAADWIESHCCVPDGFALGDPLVLQGQQLRFAAAHYTVKPGVEFNPARPLQGQAFKYRRSVFIGPQKLGKSPMLAALKLFEADGPCLFGGWARGGELFRCHDAGCGCGFEYEYLPGEPMGMVRPKALIQLLATAEDQTDNVYLPMQTMVRMGPLSERLRVLEDRIATRNGGRIEPVTAKATTRLGNPINDAGADESGLYTQRNGVLKTWQTMLRGLGGMDGRSVEVTNPPDPMENSAAQQAYLSQRPDIFVFYRKPPAHWSYKNREDRRRIHKYVYDDAPWVNLDSVEAVAAELLETDPTQAMRFYGNMMVQGLGSFIPEELWDSRTEDPEREVSPGAQICLGMDGSRNSDWTAIRAETRDGYRFTPTYGPDKRPTVWNPALWGGEIPRGEVRAAVADLMAKYQVTRFYIDPQFWESTADDWALTYGDQRVIQWPTNSTSRIFPALRRYLQDMRDKSTSHDGCPYAREHALNARKAAKPGDAFTLGKPSEHQKIDVVMSDVLAHEAAADARAAGWDGADKAKSSSVLCFR